MNTTPCTKCGHPTVSPTEWERMPKPRAARRRRRAGMCDACGKRASHKPAGPKKPPADPIPRALVMADWDWLHETGELSPTDPLTERIRYAAPRIGMTEHGLEKALQRAGVRRPMPDSLTIRPEPEGSCARCRAQVVELDHVEFSVRNAAHNLRVGQDIGVPQAELDELYRLLQATKRKRAKSRRIAAEHDATHKPGQVAA